jgi:predicted transcriptional regulator
MTEATFTFRVDEALKDEFSTVAKAHDRTGAQLLRDFMRDYVKQQQKTAEYNAWLHAKVERSRASADAGNMVPDAEVEAKFAARRAKTRRQLEASK